MWYRSNTLRVLCPVIVMATRSDTPALTKFRIALRRMSCRSVPTTCALGQAVNHAFRKSFNRVPAWRPMKWGTDTAQFGSACGTGT